MTTGTPQPAPEPKTWYRKWWVWILVVAGILVVVGLVAGSSGGGENGTAPTAAPGETATTVPGDVTTTEAVDATTTTTLPPIVAEGSGTGDDVIELELPQSPLVVEFTHEGEGNFAVASLDPTSEMIEILVNEIGPYAGTRGMQFSVGEVVTGLEIMADGDWTYQIRPLFQEPIMSCPVDGQSDDIIILSNFTEVAGTADVTHAGDGNFSILAWGASGNDLLVNEMGPYDGAVAVSAGLVVWDITANGAWSVGC
jgi:hypothetical protein